MDVTRTLPNLEGVLSDVPSSIGIVHTPNEGNQVRGQYNGSDCGHRFRTLSTGLEWLAEGKDEADVATMLNIRTHRGEDLSKESRAHYEKAMEALREADARDWVFQAEERRRSREEAERWLWAARAVWLRGLVR
jgi:hypothetical protein